MPLTDDDLKSRLTEAARFAESAPWNLRAADITSARPGIATTRASTGVERRPIRRYSLVRAGIVVFACVLVAIGAVIALSRNPNTPPTPSVSGPSVTASYEALGPASQADLAKTASVMTKRTLALGLRGAVSVDGQEITVSIPAVPAAVADLGLISNTSHLYFRPVLCAAPAFATTAFGLAAIVCPASYRFSAADWTPQTFSFNPPPPWPSLAGEGSTPPGADKPGETVLLPDKQDEYGRRLVLGPAQATDAIIASTTVTATTTGQSVIKATLTKAGITLFNRLASADYHMPVAFDLGGRILDAPVIEAKNFSTGLQIAGGGGGLTRGEAREIAILLGSGTIPIQLRNLSTSFPSSWAAVPNVIGTPSAKARHLLNAYGFMNIHVTTGTNTARTPPDEVWRESPPPNTEVPRTTLITITIEAPPNSVTVPANVIGLSQREAETVLLQLGFTLATPAVSPKGMQSTTVPLDDVAATIPPVGTAQRRGTRVQLVLSTGPPGPGAVVPDVTGLTLAGATERLKAAGFVAQNVIVTVCKRSADHVIQYTDPVAGSTEPRGAVVLEYVGAYVPRSSKCRG